MPVSEILDWSATEIARRIAAREISAREVTAAYIARCERVNPQLNALVWNRFEAALQDAAAIDEKIARGERLGPLAGVPITVKECFYVEGSPACIGLARYKNERSKETGTLVQRLQQAGAILLGKTNVPQLMVWHECDNPVYGRTNNPWDLSRTPGGSTGGEAAILAAHGSALGLGNDLGGSIRVPAAWCGIHGLKPTSGRLPNSPQDAISNFAWLEEMVTSIGPLSRHVADLDLAMRVLCDNSDGNVLDGPEEEWLDYRTINVADLRIGIWQDSGGIPPAAAIERAVMTAANRLGLAGAHVAGASLPIEAAIILQTYIGLIASDGGDHLRKFAAGSRLDWRPSRILTLAGLSALPRALLVGGLKLCGQFWMSEVVKAGYRRTAGERANLVQTRDTLRADMELMMDAQQFDAILCPAHALPAPQHGKPIDLGPAATYAFLPNLLGWPAGVVSMATVNDDEQTGRLRSRDRVLQQAAAVDAGSAGLPIGVQVFARPWREDIVLAVMAAIEQALPRPVCPFMRD